jgi:hypothetical protein
MSYYIRIEPIKGQRDLYNLAKNLEERGYDDRVQYHKGGHIKGVYYADPHLKFEDEQDALAYSLTYGGEVSKEVPTFSAVDGSA